MAANDIYIFEFYVGKQTNNFICKTYLADLLYICNDLFFITSKISKINPVFTKFAKNVNFIPTLR